MRHIAFYLPQYHPIPENDTAWGRGFTEWTNVVRGRSLFRGHYQPHLPGELGFYDLRVPEVREAQGELATAYGIDGFCYYHYWFGGRRLLERPFEEVLKSGSPSLPFMLCWANESWTRRWDGHSGAVLVPETYSEADDVNHIRSLLPAFDDARYIRVKGRPVFLIYRSDALPDARRTTEVWREEARRAGAGELYLCRVESSSVTREDPSRHGFDAAVEFQPNYESRGPRMHRSLIERALTRALHPRSPFRMHYISSYAELVQRASTAPNPTYKRFPCVTPGWDNLARRPQGARILVGATPARYQAWVEAVSPRVLDYEPDEDLVFVNAWNEWAEGNHLEPDERWGRQFLEAHKTARSRFMREQKAEPIAPGVIG